MGAGHRTYECPVPFSRVTERENGSLRTETTISSKFGWDPRAAPKPSHCPLVTEKGRHCPTGREATRFLSVTLIVRPSSVTASFRGQTPAGSGLLPEGAVETQQRRQPHPWGGHSLKCVPEKTQCGQGTDRSATPEGGAPGGGRSQVTDPQVSRGRWPSLLVFALPTLRSPAQRAPPSLPLEPGHLLSRLRLSHCCPPCGGERGLEAAGYLPCAFLSVTDPAPARAAAGCTPILASLWVWNQARSTSEACL